MTAPSTEGLKPVYVRFAFGGFSAVSAHPDGSNDVAVAERFVKYVPEAAQASEAAIRNAALEEGAVICKRADHAAQINRKLNEEEGKKEWAKYWTGYADGAAICARSIRALSTTPAELK